MSHTMKCHALALLETLVYSDAIEVFEMMCSLRFMMYSKKKKKTLLEYENSCQQICMDMESVEKY